MRYHISKKTVYLLPLAVLILVLWGCSERIVNDGSNPVTLKLETTASVSELASVVDLFRLTVTGPDMTPIVAYQVYTWGPLVFELNIPAGPDRLFMLEGIVSGSESPGGDSVIYRGQAIADIEADVALNLTIHMEPVVPLLRFRPITTQAGSQGSLQVELEVFNIPNLRETELRVLYQGELLRLDSVTKGAGLDAGDALEPIVGSGLPGFQFMISDPNISTGSIVDPTGYSHLATFYFTAGIAVAPVITELEIFGVSFTTNDGSTVSLTDVFYQSGYVSMDGFTGALMNLWPVFTEVVSSEHFALDVELFNFSDLREIEFSLVHPSTEMYIDSVVKGLSLDAYDELVLMEGPTQSGFVIKVSDTGTGLIVDSDGYSNLATVHFTTYIVDQPVVAIVTPEGYTFLNRSGDSVRVADVTVEDASVSIAAFPDRIVTFPDPNLDALIRYWIGDVTQDPLYLSQVLYVTYLDNIFGEYAIDSLNGIHELVNLATAYFDLANISDLTPLSQLPVIQWLSLMENQIVDVSPLSSLTSLKHLELGNRPDFTGNAIVDISPLASLSNLTYLGLDGNSIQDLSPLVSGSVLSNGDTLSVMYNPLSETSCYEIIPTLQGNGIIVFHTCPM